jgi:hypothetical protein
MAKNLAYLRAQARTYLDEAVQADWKDTEVDRELNNGYHEVIVAVMDVYEEFYLNNASFNTIANQQEYGTANGLPGNIFKIRRLEINYNPQQVVLKQKAMPVSLDTVRTDLAGTNPEITSFRSPVYYLIGGGSTDVKLGLIPTPVQSGPDLQAGKNVKIWFVEEVADLVLSTDDVKVPYANRWAQLISRYAAAVLLSKGQQEEKVSLSYMGLFERGLLKMQQQLKSRVSDDAMSVIDTASEDVDFSSYGLL